MAANGFLGAAGTYASQAGPVVLSGPAAVKAASQLKLQHDKATQWPFNWVEPPPGSRQVFVRGFLPMPAVGVDTQVLLYKVPDSVQFVLSGIVFEAGPVTAVSPGDVLFTLDVDQPVGAVSAQGVGFTGYSAVPFNLGTRQIPWPIAPGENDVLRSNNQVRVKVTNVNAAAGSPQYVLAILRGYTMKARAA